MTTSAPFCSGGSNAPNLRDKRGRHVPMREMQEGDFFGEMSVLIGNSRSVTITAVSYCELLQLDQQTLQEITTTHVNVRQVLQEFYKQHSRHSIEAAIPGQGA